MDKPVTLASYSNIQEASIIRGMLESNGIPAMISDNNNLYVPVFGGVAVIVDEKDAARAEALLRENGDCMFIKKM